MAISKRKNQPAVDTLPPDGPVVSTTILLDLTALTTCFSVKSALSFCSTASGLISCSFHQAAEVRSASNVGHLAGKSNRAMLAMSSPVWVATLRSGSLNRRLAAAERTCSFSDSGTRDHSLVPRVLRQELPTAFFARTVASSLTFCGQNTLVVQEVNSSEDWLGR